eukprot:1447486-Pyramimonas_sp.AAC.1
MGPSGGGLGAAARAILGLRLAIGNLARTRGGGRSPPCCAADPAASPRSAAVLRPHHDCLELRGHPEGEEDGRRPPRAAGVPPRLDEDLVRRARPVGELVRQAPGGHSRGGALLGSAPGRRRLEAQRPRRRCLDALRPRRPSRLRISAGEGGVAADRHQERSLALPR